MAQIFSWKLTQGKYAYLVKNEATNRYIRNKINDIQELTTMALDVRSWSENKYSNEYTNLRNEVISTYGVDIGEDYRKFYELGGTTNEDNLKLILVSGKDGENGIAGTNGVLNESDYNTIQSAITQQINQYNVNVTNTAASISASVLNSLSQQLEDANNQIATQQSAMLELQNQMTSALTNANQALSAAQNLTASTNQNLNEILTTTNEVNNWFETNSGNVSSMLTDYDAARQNLGAIYQGQNIAQGLLTTLTTNINTLSGTIGTVGDELNALNGSVSQFASWYDVNADIVSNVSNTLNAKLGVIEEVAEFMDGDTFINKLNTTMNAQSGVIVNQATTVIGDRLTIIERNMDAMNGTLSSTLSNYNATTNQLNHINQSLNVLSGVVQTSLMSSNQNGNTSGGGGATLLDERWDVLSGMLRTVTNFLVLTNQNGDVYYRTKTPDENGHFIENLIKVSDGVYSNAETIIYGDDSVTPMYVEAIGSYFQQESNNVSIGVSSGSILSALQLGVDEDGSHIILSSDKIILDGEVISNTLQANKANIGGVEIGKGEISSSSNTGSYLLDSAGTLHATNAEISGTIYANEGKIGGFELDSYGTLLVKSNDGVLKGFLNASDRYQSNNNTIILAAGLSGITENTKLYAWQNNDDDLVLYTLVDYTDSAMSYTIGEYVKAYPEIPLSFNNETILDVKLSSISASTTNVIPYASTSQNSSEERDDSGTKTKEMVYGAQMEGGSTNITPNQTGNVNNGGGITSNADYIRCSCGQYYLRNEVRCPVCGSYNLFSYAHNHSNTTTINAETIRSLEYIGPSGNMYFIRNTNLDAFLGDVGLQNINFGDFAHTRIYDNGLMATNQIIVDDGYFGGEINSNGTFCGILDNATGDLINTNIMNSDFCGNIKLLTDNTFIKTNESGNSVFILGCDELRDDSMIQTHNMPQKMFNHVNKKQTIYTYGPGSSMESLYMFTYQSGAVITIPSMTFLFVYENNSKGKAITQPSLGFSFMTLSGQERKVYEILKYNPLSQVQNNTGRTVVYTYTTSAHTFTATKDGSCVINIQYSTTLPAKTTQGKSSVSVCVAPQSKIVVEYDSLPTTNELVTVFGKNGFRITKSGTTISLIDDEIHLKAGNQFLKISPTGITSSNSVRIP